MPGRDRTGPLGAGPRTGRGLGYCCDYEQTGAPIPPTGARGVFGFWRRGAGRGWRHGYFATGMPGWVPPTQEQVTADLKAQVDWLKGQLEAIEKRIGELTA